jgi:uncharacterized protein (DUF1015 family)
VPSISPFSALRYDEAVAGSLDDLIAPPYDVINDDDLYTLWHTSPYNIVHLTRPESPESAADELSEWRTKGVLREEKPGLWWLVQDFVGSDGVRRSREGIVGSVEATPYSEGKVLPHELTHTGPKAERLAILRATKTQLEPIFLLYDADVPIEPPTGEPDIDVSEMGARNRLWRIDSDEIDLDVPFLIADGHHRYETAVAYREENPAATHTLAVCVSSRSPGLVIYPTHRIVQEVGENPWGFMTSTWDMSSLSMYRTGNYYRLESDDDLDTREILQYHPEGIEYTPDAEHAVTQVDDGLAQLVFLVRPPTVEKVFELAGRGETMPQKSTFFFPKLTSGLLLHPV